MSLVLTVAFKIKEDKTAEFEQVVSALSGEVLANEPGARMYQLCRSQTDPTAYRLIEVYDDAAALSAHGRSDHYKAAAPKLGACIAEKPVLEKYDTIDG
jgi:quinol monooxygenase YgiN